ncbi:transposase (fragment) [Microcystis aeruginosa PCC 9443]|jgi:propanediol dehydratase small subunit|uniref:Transposase n=1 Tax=Microcystis aeruginosa PCC 9443 TaxID=1160281 RepID=I4G2E9_MICAE
MKPLYRKTLLRFLPIVVNLERANQLSLLPDKDLVDLYLLIESYQVTKSPISLVIFTATREPY